MADRLFYRITLRRPNGKTERFRFAHAWDGEAAKVTSYPTIASAAAVTRATEAGDDRVTEAGEVRALE